MKKLVALVAAIIAVSLLGCQDTKEDRGLPDVSAYKKVGMEIPVETGLAWMAAYKEKYNPQGRLLFPDYEVSSTQMENLLESVENLVGVAFHHAIDQSGKHHFILIPVDHTLGLWNDVEGRIYIDANSNSTISQDMARTWTHNYEVANPGQVWFHFFGSDIFGEMASLPYFDNLDIEPAINILDLTPQLLLIVSADGLLDLGGRVRTESSKVYDASNPCPPCPVN